MTRLILIAVMVVVAIPVIAATKALNFHFGAVQSSDEAAIIKAIQVQGFTSIIEERMAETVSVPQAIDIHFKHIGEDIGPFYDPETRDVVMPYAFWSYVSDEFTHSASEDMSVDDINTLTGDVVIHTIYHELAHALIDVLDLPITGREEDAADELATLLVMDHFDQGGEIALTAAEFFEIEGSYSDEITDEEVFGEHALDDQRFFNILCLIHGEGSTESVKAVMNDLNITEERLALCEEDYEKRRKAWDTLLKKK